MSFTPIARDSLDWDVPVNAAFTNQDSRIDVNAANIATNTSNISSLSGTVTSNLDNVVYNVRNHGAVGDGITDDSAAINALIDSLEVSTSHGTIYFPRGTYLINSALTPTKPLRYTGDQGATIKSSNNHIFDFAGNYMHPGFNGQVGVLEIDHLTLDATGGNVFNNAVINQGSFHNLDLIQRSSGFSIWNSSSTLLVINFENIISTVYGATRSVPAWTITGVSTADVANLTWTNCLFQNSDSDSTQYQVLLQATDGTANRRYHEQCAFVNCYFEKPYGGAVKCLSGQGTQFINCRCYDIFTGTVGNSLFYLGSGASSTWPTTNTTFSGTGRDLQGPNGTTTWDIQMESATLQTTISNYDVRDIPGTFTGQPFINLGGSSNVVLVNNRNQVLTNATSLNHISINQNQINVGNSTSGAALALRSNAATDGFLSGRASADAANRFVTQTGGTFQWGDGTNPVDTQLARTSAGALTLTNPVTANSASLRVVGNTIVGSSTSLTDGASGDLQIANTPTAPTANPTGGVSVYAVSGDMRTRDPSGNIVAFARLSANQADSSPATQSFITWSYDPEVVSGSGNILTSGTVYLHKVYIPANRLVTGVALGVQVAGSTLTAGQSLAGLYDSGGNRVAITADQSASWTSTGYKSINFTSTYTPSATAAGFFYVAILSVGTTPPTLYSTNAPSSLFNGNVTGATLRHATNATTQTTLASTLTLSSSASTGANSWVALF